MAKATTPQLVTRQKLAAQFGVAPGTITRWENDGCPVAKKMPRGQSTLFDPAAVNAWRVSIEAVKDADLSLEHERALLARAQREKTEMANAVMRGELLPRADVVLAGQAYTKAWTAKVRGLARRAKLAGVITTAEQTATLEALCRDILMEISSWKTPAAAKRAMTPDAG